MEKIPVSIGILTFNSAKTLARALESVKDFTEIIIADGGSTDGTIEIAHRYGAKVILQSNPGNPIVDFSLERNRMLDVATQDWFFYLDSDEVVSREFVDEVSRAVELPSGPKVYQVRYQVTNPDLSIRYRTVVPYYQPRFFSTQIGARFIKKVHEKIVWDTSKYSAGKIEGPWLVPLDIQLTFSVYKAKVNYRLPLMVREWSPSFAGLLQKGVVEPIRTCVNILLKMLYLHLRYPSRELVPLRYELYRTYSQWVIARCVWRAYLGS